MGPPEDLSILERVAKLEQKLEDLIEYEVKENTEQIQRKNNTFTFVSIIIGSLSVIALIMATFHPMK